MLSMSHRCLNAVRFGTREASPLVRFIRQWLTSKLEAPALLIEPLPEVAS